MNLKCPNCGGRVAYDPQVAKVVCEYCRWESTEDDFSDLEGRQEFDKEEEPIFVYKREEQKETDLLQDADDVEEYMEANIYHCKTCGAELMLNGTEASTFCGFCGASTIVFERVSKETRPRWILPFKLTKEQALASIKAHFSKGDYIPSKIRELTVDKVQGVYMPYWLFDTYIRRSMEVEATTHDDGTFLYERDASCHFQDVTLDASLRLNNALSRRLEPFHTEELVEFDVAYLSGYYADRYDVPKEALENKSVQRCRDFLNDAILDSCGRVNKRTVGGLSNYRMKNVHEIYQVERVDYAFLPAYFVNIKYEKGRELVIVNGQTGKVVANLPFEKKQIRKKFLKNFLIACPAFSLTSYGILEWRFYPAFLILAAIVGFAVAGGVSGYRKYKMGKYRMSTSNMTSYINDREDII